MSPDQTDRSQSPRNADHADGQTDQKSANQEIDLLEDAWRSDRKGKREPIFGHGAVPLLGEMIILAAGLGILFAVLVLANVVKQKANSFLFDHAPLTSDLGQRGSH